MKKLENRLYWIKLTLNSYYGSNDKLSKIYEESHLLRTKISKIKCRRSRIKSILNG